MQSKRIKLELEALASSLRVQLKYFQQKSPLDDVILVELHQLQKYLKFKLAQATFDEAQVSAIAKLEAMRHAIVAKTLRNFDSQEKETKELKV